MVRSRSLLEGNRQPGKSSSDLEDHQKKKSLLDMVDQTTKLNNEILSTTGIFDDVKISTQTNTFLMDRILRITNRNDAFIFHDENGGELDPENYPMNEIMKNKKPCRNRIIGIRNREDDSLSWHIIDIIPEFGPGGDLKKISISSKDISLIFEEIESLRNEKDELMKNMEENHEQITILRTELMKFNDNMLEREMRIVEIKKEVNELCKKLGLESRYMILH